jgi:3-deoxy-manno-octulosonate cytidylyltransferase (CMP-KDO synthetase)
MNLNTKILILIPARMGSSRFPGKPLALMRGKPMLGWVYDAVSKNTIQADTVVATCDHEIQDYISSIGGIAVMTSPTHERASDRCAEALIKYEQLKNLKYDIVVMVQGDEPMVCPEMLSQAIKPLIEDHNVVVTNLMGDIESIAEFEDRNCIKVVCDVDQNAIYFSREPIPTRSKQSAVLMRKQVCVIPFRRDYLIDYTKMSPTPLEVFESIDMLRIIENGHKVRMVPTNYKSYSVDTPEDLLRVEKMLS